MRTWTRTEPVPIGTELRVLAALRGITGREIARRTGIPATTVSRYLRDRTIPEPSTAERIRDAICEAA